MTEFRRTLIAGIVTAIAICIPCGAWFVSGSGAARHEAERLLQEPETEARLEAERLANQLQMRLESMRYGESRRSPLDYQSSDDSFLSDCDDELLLTSSLAEGPADPLIWTHFQMDEVGQLTLPSGRSGGLATGASHSNDQDQIFEELECATSFRVAALSDDGFDSADERLIHTREGPATVGPFEWFTLTIDDQPSLVALRTVRTTSTVLTQGFVVLRDSLEENLAGSPFEINIEPGEPSQVGEGLLLLNDQRWTVRVSLDQRLSAAAIEAQKVIDRFRLRFVLSSLGVSLSGMLLIGLVWQADRLAYRQSQFAASAAHELRTPLAGLRLYAEMLAEGIGNPGNREKYARRIAEEAERLGRVVTNVMGYSRLERGGLSIRPESGDLAASIRSSVVRLGPALESKGVCLKLHIDEPIGEAIFDPDAVHQILLNLVDNAEKYSRNSDDRTIEVRLTAKAGSPVLTVADHGPGIDAGVRARLFEPFARTQDTDAPAGLGIGLALVKALASEQKAAISVSDVSGGGSCFSVKFRPA